MFTKKQRPQYEGQWRVVAHVDELMWSNFGHQDSEIIVHDVGIAGFTDWESETSAWMWYHLDRALLWSTSMFATAGWTVSSPLGLPSDIIDAADVVQRRNS